MGVFYILSQLKEEISWIIKSKVVGYSNIHEGIYIIQTPCPAMIDFKGS